MRYMHPVGLHEKFVASGVYVHYKDGISTGGMEEWMIHEQPDGAHKIRVDEDGRAHDGGSVLIEAWRSPDIEGGHIERFDIHAFGANGDPIQQLLATYTIVDDKFLEAGRTIDDHAREQFELTLPEDYIVTPKSLIFTGYEAYHLALETGDAVPIVSYFPTLMNDYAYKPVVYNLSGEFIKQDVIAVDGVEIEARLYEQVNPVDNSKTLVWIDGHQTLLKFQTPDGRHSAELTRYARRPDPK
jgi:hypothetical protein